MKLKYKSNSSTILTREYSYIQKASPHKETKRLHSLNYLARINLYLSLILLPFLCVNFPPNKILIILFWLFILTILGMNYYLRYDKQLLKSIIKDHNSRSEDHPYSEYVITDTQFIWMDLGNSYSLFLKNLINVENDERRLILTFSDSYQIYMVSELFSSLEEQSKWSTYLKEKINI
ncbi:hypothetical protein LNTAR_19327 [Lentisphaera araneosa HTCC2155]|uniref:YcxB-like protein domain-containing protein n=1 Tax=Lentisphaera araneosa HTCC2155 TaxID=313628 RepID=A6DQT1_9BACT|nr:hypothetical protein LNTAR_19327 [Lentisphaera araneosa HTCC2155]